MAFHTKWHNLNLENPHPSKGMTAYMNYILRIPDSYDAKIVRICNFWTFWPVIQLINHLFKIWLQKCHCTFYIYGALGKRDFCRILNRGLISWITGQNFQRLEIFTILASQLSGILKMISRVGQCFLQSLNVWISVIPIPIQV